MLPLIPKLAKENKGDKYCRVGSWILKQINFMLWTKSFTKSSGNVEFHFLRNGIKYIFTAKIN